MHACTHNLHIAEMCMMFRDRQFISRFLLAHCVLDQSGCGYIYKQNMSWKYQMVFFVLKFEVSQGFELLCIFLALNKAMQGKLWGNVYIKYAIHSRLIF